MEICFLNDMVGYQLDYMSNEPQPIYGKHPWETSILMDLPWIKSYEMPL